MCRSTKYLFPRSQPRTYGPHAQRRPRYYSRTRSNVRPLLGASASSRQLALLVHDSPELSCAAAKRAPPLRGISIDLQIFWRVKSFDAILATAEKNKLHRSLDAWQLTLLGVGAIIVTGIFVLTAEAAQKARV